MTILVSIFCITCHVLLHNSHATTFVPFKAVKQIENAQYVIRGTVIDEKVETDPATNHPYTYWNLRVTETFRGKEIGEEVTVRQIGGEVGKIGYHVAGAAKLNIGEDVVLTVRDTNHSNVKDLIGLASGKYTVVQNGDSVSLQNGLGFVLRDANNKVMNIDTFRQFVDRINRGTTTRSDRSIILSGHPHANHQQHPNIGKKLKRKPNFKTATGNEPKKTLLTTNQLQKTDNKPDRFSAKEEKTKAWPMSIKIIGILFLISITGFVYVLFRG